MVLKPTQPKIQALKVSEFALSWASKSMQESPSNEGKNFIEFDNFWALKCLHLMFLNRVNYQCPDNNLCWLYHCQQTVTFLKWSKKCAVFSENQFQLHLRTLALSTKQKHTVLMINGKLEILNLL